MIRSLVVSMAHRFVFLLPIAVTVKGTIRHHRRRLLLVLIRTLGGFALAKMLTRRGLRILCYHGVSLDDEHLFRPHLFIRVEELNRRLAYLARKRFNVLPLEDALDARL